MKAIAFSNNDMAVVAWTYDRHLDGCLGFAIYRVDPKTGAEVALPALARFASTVDVKNQTTADAPIQKFWWKDLYAERGSSVQYKVVPMAGKPGALRPLAGVEPLVSNVVTLSPDRGIFKAYFNRGIVATQALRHALGDKPDIGLLQKSIADPKNKIRIGLEGQLYEGVTSLLDRADAAPGASSILAALYELNDPKGLEVRLGATDRGDANARTVILGNARTETSEDSDSENRKALRDAGVNVLDRILGAGAIPHDKFMILNEGGKPAAVMTGSTNWTMTGLCTQTNNALVIQSAKAGDVYTEFWKRLEADINAAGGDQSLMQGEKLRTDNRNANSAMVAAPLLLEDGTTRIEIHASPSTKKPLQSPPKEVPVDMKRLYHLVLGAKHAVLFLAFDPGNNSILDAAGQALAANPKLFVRGALTNTVRAGNFKEALEKASKATGKGADMSVAVIGEPGGPAKKPPKGEKKPAVEPDYRAIPAGSINKDDAFGAWEAEIYKVGFAIIHNKVVVIDPFSDDCVVITGSHNLGYRASHNNDENMVIVHGHRPLAEAYACHVLDLYDHYAYRYWLKKSPGLFGKPLDDTDGWQERYIKEGQAKSAELMFWLNAEAHVSAA